VEGWHRSEKAVVRRDDWADIVTEQGIVHFDLAQSYKQAAATN
jgi:hypothetical protein